MRFAGNMRMAAGIGEVWRFREVIKNFVAQDLKVKYRRSALGFLWSLMNPMLQMIVLSTVFSLMFHIPNFTLYVLSGIVCWGFFATSVDACAVSIIGAESMLKRQYFPKLVFPLSSVTQNLVTLCLSLTALLILVGPFVGFRLSTSLLILPLSFACIFAFTLGVGAIAAVITVHFRDMQHLITVFLSALFYLTPIIYPLEDKSTVHPPATTTTTTAAADSAAPTAGRAAVVKGPIPDRYRTYFKANPLFALLSMFQRPIYDGRFPTHRELATAVSVAAGALVLGLYVFRRAEDGLIFRL